MSVNVDQIVISDKFKHSDEGFKYFIGYQEGEIVKPLCIILPQMSGYIKYFENGGKNMSFLIKDDEVWEKYEQIWDVIKNKLSIKFHSKPIYDQKYLQAKVRLCADFEQVILLLIAGHINPALFMPISLREQFFSQALFQTYFLLGSKTYKHVSYLNAYLHC